MNNQKKVRQVLHHLGRNAVLLFAHGKKLFPSQIPQTVYLELKGDYPIFAPKSPIPIPIPGQKKTMTLEVFKQQLEAIARVKGIKDIVILERGFSGDLSKAYAIRQCLLALRDSGKNLIFYADFFSNVTLYIASVCQQLVTLEAGRVHVVGLAGRVLFQAGLLEKIGLEVEYERRGEYKNAPNQYTETRFTPEHHEALQSALESVYQHWRSSIATERQLEIEVLQKAVIGAPLLSDEALQRGLITKIAFEDQLMLDAKSLLEAVCFAPVPRMSWGQSGRLALIGIEGSIVDGESKNIPLPIPFFGGRSAGGYSVARAIRQAAQDQEVKAIVLAVDSPGGSSLASEIIWREVTRAKQHKPVVAIMGNSAASGGYYVACAATKILAAPSTITGSIGVFYLHISGAKLWEKLGLHPETIKFAENADYYSTDRRLSQSEKEYTKRSVERIYQTFKTRVADGRRLSLEAVEKVARGRIWTGLQAVEHGLVDEIGSLFDGLRLARELAGLPEDAPVQHMTPPAKYIVPTNIAAMIQMLEPQVWALLPEQLEIR